jgi:MerR family transcriptional regulator, mercuric resistance operon regulatory protein
LTSLSDISIGDLSRQSECHVETIRYYERIGLLPKPRRQGRHRRYGADDVARLRFIRRARQFGFRLEDVRVLVRLASGTREVVCAEARQLAAARVAEVRAKIADLQAMERILTGAICQCDAARGSACPIIEVISGSEIA